MSQRKKQRGGLTKRKEKDLQGNRILIVSEGEKTEVNYFKALRSKLSLSAIQIEVWHPNATDTKNLIRHARTRADEIEKDDGVKFEEVWVVGDLERIHSKRREDFTDAIALAKKEKVSLAISDPCFEFWYLIHFVQTTKPYTKCDSVAKDLKKYWPDYDKNISIPDSFFEKIEEAIVNAKFCEQHHTASGGYGNPSTQVYKLVESMNKATREHNRLF